MVCLLYNRIVYQDSHMCLSIVSDLEAIFGGQELWLRAILEVCKNFKVFPAGNIYIGAIY